MHFRGGRSARKCPPAFFQIRRFSVILANPVAGDAGGSGAFGSGAGGAAVTSLGLRLNTCTVGLTCWNLPTIVLPDLPPDAALAFSPKSTILVSVAL